MRSFLGRKLFFVVIIAVVAGGVAWFFLGPSKANAQKKASKKPQTVTVARQTIRQTLTISGELAADETATLRFQTSGTLAWVGVKVGDRVKKYQAIAGLDQRELKKKLDKYLLTYQKVRWDFDQTKDEYRDPAGAYWGLSEDARNKIDRALQKSQFDLTSSVLDVEIQDIALKYATLTTPIEGIVTRVAVPFAGMNITPASAEFEILNPATLYLSVLADQTEVIKLSTGMQATMTFDAFPDRTVTGTIKDISFTPKAGETGTVYEVKLAVPDTETTPYRLGMTGDAMFVMSEKKDVLSAPPAFIKTEGSKKYVLRKTGNKKEKVYVETGVETETLVEIASGLAEGDTLYD